MTTIRVTIAGASGRMGRALVRALGEASDMRLAFALEHDGHKDLGADAGELAGLARSHVPLTSDALTALANSDAVLDFTRPDASAALAELAAQARIVHVIGTTGHSDAELSRIKAAARHATIVKSGNMSLGVNLLAALVKQAAKALADYDIEILEMHHRMKLDAPSGTALLLGEAAAEGRGIVLREHEVRVRDGQTGARPDGAIGFASLRGGTVIGDHMVVLAGPHERLELTHRAEDRTIFARGALAAARWGQGRKPGLYAMRDVLGLSSWNGDLKWQTEMANEMRVKVFSLAVLSAMAAAGSAFAQTDRQFKECNGADPAIAIISCSAVIEAHIQPPRVISGAYANRARAYVVRNQIERAISDFDKAIQTDPKNGRVRAIRGDYYQSKGDYERALADYDQAVLLDPKDFEAFSQRGNLRLIQGEPEKAIPDYANAIAVNPKFAAAYANRGEAYRVQGEDDKAIADFNRAIAIEPKFATAYLNRGLARTSKGDAPAAIEDFNRALGIDPKLTEAYTYRASAYEDAGAHDKALSDFETALKLDPNNAAIYASRGNAFQVHGDFDRALADFDAAIKLDRNSADAFNNRGIVYARKGDYNRAVVDFDQAATLDPNLPDVYANRGLALVKTGQYKRAIADLDKALAGNPNDAASLYNRGVAKQKEGDIAGADADIARAKVIDPAVVSR